MTYATTPQVKDKLPLALVAAEDAIIDDLRDRYYAHINARLRRYTTVPLLPASDDYDVLTEVECLWVAGAYIKSKDDVPSGDERKGGQRFEIQAKELLDAFIASKFSPGPITKRANLFGQQRSAMSWSADDSDLDAD